MIARLCVGRRQKKCIMMGKGRYLRAGLSSVETGDHHLPLCSLSTVSGSALEFPEASVLWVLPLFLA